jgi:hypothetical protein
MFDNVKVVYIDHPEFIDNDMLFQTKDMNLELEDYYVFDNRLWKRQTYHVGTSKTPVTLSEMEQVNHDGELNIYERVENDRYTQWIEYNLTFEGGRLVGVENLSKEKKLKDVSEQRPNLSSIGAVVKIDLSHRSDKENQAFYEYLSDNLDKVREIVGDEKATIFYTREPVPTSENQGTMGVIRGRNRGMVASVVQDFVELGFDTGSKNKTIQAPNGDSVKIIVDEASMYLGSKE